MSNLGIKLPVQFLLTVIGILLLGSLPYLFFDIEAQLPILKMIETGSLKNTHFLYDKMTINFGEYFHQIYSTIISLGHLSEIEYYSRGAYFVLFPDFLNKYVFSMLQLSTALIIGLFMSILITYFIMMIPSRMNKIAKFVLFIFESLPDLFVVILFQLAVILIYKKTDWLLFNITNSYGDPAYAFPIIVLSFLPTVYITKYLLLAFEEEKGRLYVELARGKGLRRSRILLIHILRNATITLFNNFKTIFWFALSNLLMLEVVFNVKGFTNFILQNAVINPHIMTIGLLMVFIPFFFIFTIGNLVIRKVVQ